MDTSGEFGVTDYKLQLQLFVMKDLHQDPNVYLIWPINGKGPLQNFNHEQLYDLKNSKGGCKSVRSWPKHGFSPLSTYEEDSK